MTNELTTEKLAELRVLAEGATPGPWMVDGIWIYAQKRVVALVYKYALGNQGVATVKFIAALDPATVLALLDAATERDALKAQVAELTLELGYPTKHYPTIRVDLSNREYPLLCPAGPFDIVQLEHMQTEVSKNGWEDDSPEDAKIALCEVEFHAEESDYHTGLYIPPWYEFTPISYERFDADEWAEIQKQRAAQEAALLTEFQEEQACGDPFANE